MSLGVQITWLFVLALPVACVAWTFTHEEIFREPREYCAARSVKCRRLFERKFFYVFTCEYCFSHYATIALLFLTRYHLLFPDWRATSSLLSHWSGSRTSTWEFSGACAWRSRANDLRSHWKRSNCQKRPGVRVFGLLAGVRVAQHNFLLAR